MFGAAALPHSPIDGPTASAAVAPAPLMQCVGAPEVEGWRGRWGEPHVATGWGYYCGPGYAYPAEWYNYWAVQNANLFTVYPGEVACPTWSFVWEGRFYCYN